jgi:hypothetical protein
MIKLTRTPLEAALQLRLNALELDLLRHLDAGTPPPQAILDGYRYPPLKAHLIKESRGKCVYCESKITHVYYGDVEHIRPKSIFPRERLHVSNLALACALCNNAKKDYWDATYCLIDPFTDNPADEILSLGYMVVRKPGRDRARITIEKVDLNRPALLERRKELIERIQPLADQYVLAPAGALKDLLLVELKKLAADDSEYSLSVRAYLKAVCEIDC